MANNTKHRTGKRRPIKKSERYARLVKKWASRIAVILSVYGGLYLFSPAKPQSKDTHPKKDKVTIDEHNKQDTINRIQANKVKYFETRSSIEGQAQINSPKISVKSVQLANSDIHPEFNKQEFYRKYRSVNDIFMANYQTAKQNEELIVAFIACMEGFRKNAYDYEGGRPTIGYGTRLTIIDGSKDNRGFLRTKPVEIGMTTDKSRAYADATAHLDKYVYAQLQHIHVPLTANQLIAVCSYLYNTGGSDFKKSELCAVINKNPSDTEKIRQAFVSKINIKGKPNRGLRERRGIEGVIWSHKHAAICLFLKSNIVSNSAIRYYEYQSNGLPLQSSDKKLVLKDINTIEKDLSRFTTYKLNESIISLLPKDKQQNILNRYCITNGNTIRLKPSVNQEFAVSYGVKRVTQNLYGR